MRTSSSLCVALGLLGTLLVAGAPPKVHGVDPATMDLSAKPCEDFYQYANGAWLKANPIPAEESSWGGFVEVRDRTREDLRSILEATSSKKDWPKGSIQQKVGDFFAAGMDVKALEKAGTAPIKPLLAAIDGLKDVKGLAMLMADFQAKGLGSGFRFRVAQDPKESTKYLAGVHQGGLGLPDRDYYLRQDAKSVTLRGKYVDHMAKMFVLLGEKPLLAKAHAGMVMGMETRMAKASMTRVEMRDPNATYHKMTVADLAKAAPGFDWDAYFKGLGALSLAELNVSQPGFCREFGAMASTVSLSEWKVYLRWHVLRATAPGLSKAFEDQSFDFYERTLNGIPQQQARWKRIVASEDMALGEALGQLYVEKNFPPEAKKQMLTLVDNLRSALKERIQGLDWMTAETRTAALAKLAAFNVKIAYPDQWKDYTKLDIKRDSYAGNLLRARVFEFKRNLDKLGKPIDRNEWGMAPQTVNAYYSPTMNEIVFPAAILQPPFFDPKADDACNYGGIGAVIGHEMTHGFDDQGSQYDAQGNLRNWWQDADRKAYKSRTDLVVKEFDGFMALPDLAVNGKLTLGENIADLGGLKIAFAAWKHTLKAPPAPIAGFTGEQRFFLTFASIWRNNTREEAARVRLNTDPHSPGKFRVLGPLTNLPEFYEAFGCGEGTPMVRPAALRPAIW